MNFQLYFCLFSWGRGHPEQAINLGGDECYDSMDSDKKPRAGQILWIRGLTRLQTQVSGEFDPTPRPFISFSLSLKQ